MDPNVAKALKAVFLFRDAPEDVVKAAADCAERRAVDVGENIVNEGDPADSMFVILQGSVRVSKRARDESDEEVVMLGTGSHFGEIALLDSAPRSATVTANEHCELLVLRSARLQERLERSPAAGLFVYRALARSVAKRLRQTTDDLGFARQLAKERRH